MNLLALKKTYHQTHNQNEANVFYIPEVILGSISMQRIMKIPEKAEHPYNLTIAELCR